MTLLALAGLVYVGVVLGVGYLGRQRSQTLEGFFAAHRSIPWWGAALSMVATTFASDTPLAVTEMVRQGGIAQNWLWWNMLIGGMLAVAFYATLWRKSGVLTDSEILTLRYTGKGATLLRKVRAFYIGIFYNLIILGWVQLAMLQILQTLFSLTYLQALSILAFLTAVVTVYTLWGGLWSVIYTDILQFAIALGGSILLAYYALVATPWEKIPSWALVLLPDFSAEGTVFTLGAFLTYVGVQWWASWFPGGEPGGGGYIVQRMVSTPDPTQARKALFAFQILHYIVRPWAWIVVALASLVHFPTAQNHKEVYLLMAQKFFSTPLMVLFLIGMMGAYMSTLSTHLNWGASYVGRDLVSETKGLRWGKMSLVLLALVSLGIVPWMDSIAGAWRFLIEAGAGSGWVLLMRWFWKRLTVAAEIAALTLPVVGYLVFRIFLDWGFPEGYLANVALTVLGSLGINFLFRPDLSAWEAFQKKVQPSLRWGSGVVWITGTVGAYAWLIALGKAMQLNFWAAIVLFGIGTAFLAIAFYRIR
ncbi:MAG: sodium:solute symporter family transporter [Bacteroidia bacterium]